MFRILKIEKDNCQTINSYQRNIILKDKGKAQTSYTDM